MRTDVDDFDKRDAMVIGRLSSDKKQYIVICPWCNEKHYHGSATAGHRWAHCTNKRGETRGYTIIPEKTYLQRIKSWK